MILAEKIIQLRKQLGWSQEELAEKLSVSRQAVSKWESGNSIPDIEKIINMSGIFGVSTDYLLKDDIEVPTPSEGSEGSDDDLYQTISVEEANDYMSLARNYSKKLAWSVQALILSPVCLILLAGFSDSGKLIFSEELAAGLGITVLLIIVALSVGVIILNDIPMKKYEFIKKDCVNLQYGVSGIVKKYKEEFENTYRTSIALGVILCIIGVIPLILSAFLENDIITISCVGLLLVSVSFGVNLFVRVSTVMESYTSLLQEGEFSIKAKKDAKSIEYFPAIYWCTVVAIFLGISFYFNNWDRSWIIWPVAALIFAALRAIMLAFIKSRQK